MIKSLGLEWVLQAFGLAYIVLVLFAASLPLRRGKTMLRKLGGAAAVLLVLTAPLTWRLAKTLDLRLRYAKANSLFEQRCKTAGERVYETVNNVDGVLLMKPRPASINLADQFALDDPYGRDFGGKDYIERLFDGAQYRRYLHAEPHKGHV